MKEVVAMGCITVLGAIQLIVYGDGAVLTACVAAISTLAGVSMGSEIQKKKE